MKHRDVVLARATDVIATAEGAWDIRRRAMCAFEQVLLRPHESSEVGDAELLNDLAPLQSTLNRLYESFETQLEIAFAQDLLSGEVSLHDYALFSRFEHLVSAEIVLSGLCHTDKVAMIGSGPFPITAILLSKAGLTVTAIDRDSSSVALSRRVITHLGLEDRISVYEGDGQYVILPDTSCVLVAVLATPKERILQNILSTWIACRRVICRTSEGIRLAFYRPVDTSSLHGYSVVGTNTASGDQTISSLLLMRTQR